MTAPRRSHTMRTLDESLPLALLRAREAAMAQFRPHLVRHGVTDQQWRVLRALFETDEPLIATDLAARVVVLAQSLTRIVANLAGRGLVDQQREGRTLRISITPAGRQLVAAVWPESAAAYAAIESAFGRERLEELMAMLDELAAALRR